MPETTIEAPERVILKQSLQRHQPAFYLVQRLAVRASGAHLVEDMRRQLRRQDFRLVGQHPVDFGPQVRLVAERDLSHVAADLRRAARYLAPGNDADSILDGAEAERIAGVLLSLIGE